MLRRCKEGSAGEASEGRCKGAAAYGIPDADDGAGLADQAVLFGKLVLRAVHDLTLEVLLVLELRDKPAPAVPARRDQHVVEGLRRLCCLPLRSGGAVRHLPRVVRGLPARRDQGDARAELDPLVELELGDVLA